MAKRIVILGAGESGAGAAVLAKKQGFDTFVSDMSMIKSKYKDMLNERGIAWEEGKHTEELILNADEVIKSPGIPNDAPMILKLKAQGTPIISGIEFAGRYTNARIMWMQNSVSYKIRRTKMPLFSGMMIRLFSVSYINMEFTDTTIPLPSKKKKEQQPMLRKTRYASPNRLLSIWNKKSWP